MIIYGCPIKTRIQMVLSDGNIDMCVILYKLCADKNVQSGG
jgi:hypothetical protein